MEQIIEILTPWAKPFLVFCGFMLIRYLYRTVILRFLQLLNNKMSFEYGGDILDAFAKPIHIFLFILGVYAALNCSPITFVTDHPAIDKFLRSSFIIAIFWGIYNISDITHGIALKILTRAEINIEDSLANILSTMFRILIVVIATLMIAKEWNYDMSGLLASLSIGSLALAFAAKDALANVFGSFVIIVDKPFKVGDWISANGVEGTVEKITFRSTCIRTFPQELVYVPNSLLSNTPIINYTKREKRRIEFLLGVTYDTTHDQMQKLVENIRTYLTNSELVYSDTVMVYFRDYADSSLNIFIVCYTKASDTKGFLAAREQINLDIMKILEENGASCAFPSTSVYFETPLKSETKKQLNTKIKRQLLRLPFYFCASLLL